MNTNNGTKDTLIRILLSLLLVMMGGIGALNQVQLDTLNKALSQVWHKLDGMNSFIMLREEALRKEQAQISDKLSTACIELEKLKVKVDKK